MACPFFDPKAPYSWKAWPNPPRMPLGDPHLGHCTAVPEPTREEFDFAVRETCNTGYARGICPRFPGGDAPDAVRFGLVALKPPLATIQYVRERGHHPLEHGTLNLVFNSEGAVAETILERQAGAFLFSYLRRNEFHRIETTSGRR